MKKYILVYQGGMPPATPEEGKRVMDAWLSWFEYIGDKLVDKGFPTEQMGQVVEGEMEATVSNLPISGYSVITAENMDEAVKIAKQCPQLASKGQVHVFEEVPIDMQA